MNSIRSIRTLLALSLLAALPAIARAADANAPVNASDYKPPIRVACLGDSITYGVGAKPGFAWPDQLDRMLGEAWDVRNFGHSGASVARGDKHSIWSQKEYQEALQFHPDVVILLLGTNDTKPENWAAKDAFPKLYKELVVSFQKLSSKPRVFCGLPPYVARKGAFGINESGILQEIPMIKQVASDWNAAVIDIHAATDKQDALFHDNVHPGTEGATLIAKAVYAVITGREWTGEIPAAAPKPKPPVRISEHPGELTYHECFALIACTGISANKLAPIRDNFEAAAGEVDAKIAGYENQIKECETLRMKYKHAPEPDQQKLYGVYKSKGKDLTIELARYKMSMNMAMIALIPAEYKSAFGAEWVNRYVQDRLLPIASTLTPEQRKKLRDICKKHGESLGAITNTPERSVEHVEVYKEVYEQVLNGDQKKCVEPL